MAHSTKQSVIWFINDALWERLAELLNEYDPPKPTGRRRAPARPILNALLFRLRTGCQWNHLPTEYGNDSTIHRRFQHWVEIGLFARLWSLLVAENDVLGLVQWDWQAADGTLGKARGGGDEVGPNPTDRAKNGTKKHLLVDGQGGPLSVVIAPANVNDHLLLEETLEAIIVERPAVTGARPQHLCLDAAYRNEPSRQVVQAAGYEGHVASEEKAGKRKPGKKYRARRWVVERTIAWLSKYRGLLIRYERKSENYLALLQFACALIWYRRLPEPK